jgi:hypothetical protein
LLTLGFTEQTVETNSLPALVSQFLDSDMDIPPFVKEYTAEYNVAIGARMTATANQLVSDLAELYRNNEWDLITKIRSMTEEGFTFVDAITACRPGLARRASIINVRKSGFSDLGV